MTQTIELTVPDVPGEGRGTPLGQLTALVTRLRELHNVVMAPDDVAVCEHCCVNRVGDRRFSCRSQHGHRSQSHPCPTLALLAELGL